MKFFYSKIDKCAKSLIGQFGLYEAHIAYRFSLNRYKTSDQLNILLRNILKK